jgi:hypothetical protein
MTKRLKIKLIPYEKFRRDGFKSLMNDLRESTIVLIDAKLKAEEEAAIIEETMRKITGKFSGIELNSLEMNDAEDQGMNRLRSVLSERITGKKRGMTIIGPSKIVHEIRKNPEELLLYMSDR